MEFIWDLLDVLVEPRNHFPYQKWLCKSNQLWYWLKTWKVLHLRLLIWYVLRANLELYKRYIKMISIFRILIYNIRSGIINFITEYCGGWSYFSKACCLSYLWAHTQFHISIRPKSKRSIRYSVRILKLRSNHRRRFFC